jgi:hypothetical protein
MIQLSADQIKELETYLMEIPAKFANPILGFLGKLAQEQNPPQEVTDPFNNPNDPNAGLG